MSVHRVATLTLASSLLVIGAPINAQLGDFLNRVKSKAADRIGHQIGPDRQPRQDGAASDDEHHSLVINQYYDFIQGTESLVHTDFADAAIGSMPTTWKTNGSGDVVTVQGLSGKWLRLQDFASYKLVNPPQLPPRFTVQFDIVVSADVTRDIGFIHAGFAKDNSVRTYLQDAYNDGAINAVTFGYAGDGGVASSATSYNHPIVMDMRAFSNRVMHVSIAVDGDIERIYLDRDKIADAKLFDGNSAKYFFLSAPTSTEHNAKVLFGNFRIDSFR